MGVYDKDTPYLVYTDEGETRPEWVVKLYNSSRWKQLAHKVKQKQNYFCQQCLDEYGILTDISGRKGVVHHIKYLRHRPDLAFDESNLVGLCHDCHNQIHKSQEINDEMNIRNKVKSSGLVSMNDLLDIFE